jgi:DNA-binding NarL/FixJ family response regulator
MARIITVDSTGTVARIVSGTLQLLHRNAVQIDVPQGEAALEELQRGGVQMVVSAWELYNDMGGLELALRVKQSAPDTAVIVLGDTDDPETLDEETEASPFVYLHRPVDVHQFLRVFQAGLDQEDIFKAMSSPMAEVERVIDRGPVPVINRQPAGKILNDLLRETGAMAVLLTKRTAEIELEAGAAGYLDRERLTNALMPMVGNVIEMGGIVGGSASSLHFYDGDDRDIFVFSVGVHYFLVLVFDGQSGSRKFGVVKSVGGRAVADLTALLGASAMVLQQPSPAQQAAPALKRKTRTGPLAPQLEEALIVRPEISVPEPEPLKLDPIQNFDASIFDGLPALDASAANDIFDLENLEALVKNTSGRKEVSFEEAMELGVLPDIEPTAKQ